MLPTDLVDMLEGDKTQNIRVLGQGRISRLTD